MAASLLFFASAIALASGHVHGGSVMDQASVDASIRGGRFVDGAAPEGRGRRLIPLDMECGATTCSPSFCVGVPNPACTFSASNADITKAINSAVCNSSCVASTSTRCSTWIAAAAA
jgi:hypothetical protein